MNSFLNFGEKDVVIVTGVTSGFGLAVCKKLLEIGVSVIGIGRNEEKLNALKQDLNNNQNFYPKVLDLQNNIETISAFIDELRNKEYLWGGGIKQITGFVHCAGALRLAPVKLENLQSQIELFKLNYFSAIEFIKKLADKKYMAERLSCVFISSISALGGSGGLTTYSATKGALISATKSLAKELGRYNVRVNSICAGTVKTNISQANKAFFNDNYYENIKKKWVLPYESSPEQIADAIIYLLSNASSWITGQIIVVDGGESLLF